MANAGAALKFSAKPASAFPFPYWALYQMTQLSYAAAGVSIDNGDALVDRIKPAAKRTMIPGVL